MRKVTFPFELDATEYCTEELKAKLIPIRDKIRNLRKDAMDKESARKKTRKANAFQAIADQAATAASTVASAAGSVVAAATGVSNTSTRDTGAQDDDTTMAIDETPEEKKEIAAKAAESWEKELKEVVDPELVKDEGANVTGLYELMGLITHQGAGADSGHYCSYVKKEGGDGKTWWFFNDDRVSEVGEEKIEQLSGGGKNRPCWTLIFILM